MKTEMSEPSAAPDLKQTQNALRKYVENFYDFQERRIQAQGRTTPKAKDAPIILHEIDLVRLERHVKELAAAEKNALADVAFGLKRMPFYKDVLSDKKRYRGLGPTMAGVILSSFDIHREEMVSQLWSFAGLAPVPCYRCANCQGEVVPLPDGGYTHVKDWSWKKYGCRLGDSIVQAVYQSGKSMKPVKGEKISYNKWLRAKLCGVLGGCLLKSGSPWAKFYYDYKNRKTNDKWGRSDNHRHKAAIRYMIKMLLLDIWKEWRAYEGLPVRPPYQEEYLGHKHHAGKSDGYGIESSVENMAVDEELELAEKGIDNL